MTKHYASDTPQTAVREIQPSRPHEPLIPPSDLPRLADKREVARMLKMSVRMVDTLLAQGLPHLRFGTRRVRFDLEEVSEWLRARFGTRRIGKANGRG